MIDNSAIKKYLPKGKSREAIFKREVISDYWTCAVSRAASLMARKEVLTGKAKFGITGDGKELPQIAMAKYFEKGDWRSGYYRDQTFMMAKGLCTVAQFFAQLYADVDNDPFSGGRQMNNHFATPTIDKEGKWISHLDRYNVSSDISSTAGQMARGLGLGMASQKYRQQKLPASKTKLFSKKGNEISFCTIGDASTSEGVFWETLNAAAVMQIPMIVSVWDDGYGISVPKELQTTKGSISKALYGLEVEETSNGIYIFKVSGSDYPGLCQAYEECTKLVRKTHTPALIHVTDLTQPQGHSTSGSHERYKTKERLAWEKKSDCNLVFGQWMVSSGLVDQKELEEINQLAVTFAKAGRDEAWANCMDPVKAVRARLEDIYKSVEQTAPIAELLTEVRHTPNAVTTELLKNARQLRYALYIDGQKIPSSLEEFIQESLADGKSTYESNLYSHSAKAATNIPIVAPQFNEEDKKVNAFEIVNKFFDAKMAKDASILAFGEDVGQIGDVNQGFAGLQEKYGKERVFDTGIREWTIMGQAIGLAMRGFRPIAEIQYLDYLIYGLQPLSDDLATLRYRSNGIQHAPAIIRTRGHRLEGIWHAGSPLGMMINALRGVYICTPRNLVQAIGMYNTLLQSDDPAIVIECLNGYRLKERYPTNALEFTVPLGVPEVLNEGHEITLVTYGSCVRIAQQAIQVLDKLKVSIELIDVQTMLPFDLEHRISESIKKTNRVIFLDEDVPGGATAFMMREVLEKQGAYAHLDSSPLTITAAANRTPFGSDGDYYIKPQAEDVVDAVIAMLKEVDPHRFDSQWS